MAPGIVIITALQNRVKRPMGVSLSKADDRDNSKIGRSGGSNVCRGLSLRPCLSWPGKCQRTVHDSALEENVFRRNGSGNPGCQR